MHSRVSAREKTGMSPGTKNQKFLENLTLAAKSGSIHLIVAMTVYSICRYDTDTAHCARVRFTVLASCNDAIAVHSCPLLYLQRGRLPNLGADCSISF